MGLNLSQAPKSLLDDREKVIFALFKVEKSRVDHVNMKILKGMIECSLRLNSTDKKFVQDIISVAFRRIKGLRKENVSKLFLAISKGEADWIKERKKEVLMILNHVLENGWLGQFSIADSAELITSIEELGKKGLFQGSLALKRHLTSELIKSAKEKFNQVLEKSQFRGKEFFSASNDMNELVRAVESTHDANDLTEEFKDLLLDLPDRTRNTELFLKKVQNLIAILKTLEEKSMAANEEEKIKLNFRINQLKSSLMGCHNRLLSFSKKCNAQEMMQAFDLFIELEALRGLPIPSLAKKLAVSKLVDESYLFTTEDLLQQFDKLKDKITGFDQLVSKQVTQLCFYEYCKLVQMEHQFRKVMRRAYEDEYEWPEEHLNAPGKFKNYQEVENSSLGSKPLFKITTLFANAMLLLSKTSFKHLITKEKLKPPSSDHLTRESAEILQNLSKALQSDS